MRRSLLTVLKVCVFVLRRSETGLWHARIPACFISALLARSIQINWLVVRERARRTGRGGEVQFFYSDSAFDKGVQMRTPGFGIWWHLREFFMHIWCRHEKKGSIGCSFLIKKNKKPALLFSALLRFIFKRANKFGLLDQVCTRALRRRKRSLQRIRKQTRWSIYTGMCFYARNLRSNQSELIEIEELFINPFL